MGLANAIALPYFLDYYRSVCPERLADLAEAAGIRRRGNSEDAPTCALAFVEAVRALNADVGIPEKAAFLKEEDIAGIVVDAFREAHGTPYPVPVILDEAELTGILRSML